MTAAGGLEILVALQRELACRLARLGQPLAAGVGVLDHHAQVVGGVGMHQRHLLGDPARPEEVIERLVEGLHPQVPGAGHDVLDLVDLALADQVADQRRLEHDLDGRAAAAIDRGQQLLGHDGPQVEGEVQPDLLVALVGEEVDDAVQRLVGVVGVQGRQAEVAGLGEGQRVLHGLPGSHLADQDDIRRLAQGVLQRHLEGVGIDTHLALVDDRLLVRMHVLDGILDADDMPAQGLVALLDHRGQGGRLAGAGPPTTNTSPRLLLASSPSTGGSESSSRWGISKAMRRITMAFWLRCWKALTRKRPLPLRLSAKLASRSTRKRSVTPPSGMAALTSSSTCSTVSPWSPMGVSLPAIFSVGGALTEISRSDASFCTMMSSS